MNSIEIVLEKLKNSKDGKVELTSKEIKMIRTALKMWNAIDDVLDDELELNGRNNTND